MSNQRVKIICKNKYNGYSPGDVVKTFVFSRWGCQAAFRFVAKSNNNYLVVISE